MLVADSQMFDSMVEATPNTTFPLLDTSMETEEEAKIEVIPFTSPEPIAPLNQDWEGNKDGVNCEKLIEDTRCQIIEEMCTPQESIKKFFGGDVPMDDVDSPVRREKLFSPEKDLHGQGEGVTWKGPS